MSIEFHWLHIAASKVRQHFFEVIRHFLHTSRFFQTKNFHRSLFLDIYCHHQSLHSGIFKEIALFRAYLF